MKQDEADEVVWLYIKGVQLGTERLFFQKYLIIISTKKYYNVWVIVLQVL